MKTVIVSGGRIERDFALRFLNENKFDTCIGVDNGLAFLYENGITPDYIVGDFDTAAPELVQYFEKQRSITEERLNPVKDCTDTQDAIELAVRIGSDEIVILGGTGTRLDHVIGNIQSLMLPLEKGVPCFIVDENNRIRLIDSDFTIRKDEQYGKYVSYLPLTTKVEGVTLKGMKYTRTDYTFTSTGSAGLGVSNEIVDDTAVIKIKSGIFIFIESRD